MNSESSEEKQFYLELYKKERELLFNAKLEQSKSFDKYIITLSSVCIGLSLTNISKAPEHVCLLFLGWLFLGLASVVSLISFLLSQRVIDKRIEIIDSYVDSLLYNYNRNKEFKGQDSFEKKIVEIANWTSLVMVVLGFVFVMSFFSINILKGG